MNEQEKSRERIANQWQQGRMLMLELATIEKGINAADEETSRHPIAMDGYLLRDAVLRRIEDFLIECTGRGDEIRTAKARHAKRLRSGIEMATEQEDVQ